MTPPLIESIYQKYISIFYEIDNGAIWIDLSAVRYAMRAALREMAAGQDRQPPIDSTSIIRINDWLAEHALNEYLAADDIADAIIAVADTLRGQVAKLHVELAAAIDERNATDAACAGMEASKPAAQPMIDQRQYEVLAKQLKRLNDWLFEHAVDLAHDPYTDTADAMIAAADRLRGTVQRLLLETATAIDERNVADAACAGMEAEVAALRSQLAQMDADNAKLAEELRTVRSWSMTPTGNGKSHPAIFPSAQSADETPAWNAAMLTGLDDATADYWHGIAAGRWTWRKLPKSVRLAMVRHVLSFGPEERAMSMSEFDAIKPHWMPGAGSHPITFGVPWSTLNDMRVEIEVTP